jgi:hypothetical protein
MTPAARWASRAATAALFLIGLASLRVAAGFILAPDAAAERMGLTPVSIAALDALRAPMGGFHLAMAGVAALGVAGRLRRSTALALVGAIPATIALLRLGSAAMHGAGVLGDHALMGEGVAVVLATAGLLADRWGGRSARLDPDGFRSRRPER